MRSSGPPQRILLLRPDKAGDALKTLPVLRLLRQQFPGFRWHVLASRHNASLFEAEGVALHVLPADWETGDRTRWSETVRWEAPFDVVLNLLCDPFPEVDRLLRWIPARRKYSAAVSDPGLIRNWEVVPVRLPGESPAGRCETRNIALLASAALGFQVPDALPSGAPRLMVADETEAARNMGDKRQVWIGLCPFAGLRNRSHPEHRWKRFFLRLVARHGRHCHLFLFGAPADRPRLEDWRLGCASPDRVTVCSPSSFRALGAYLKRLDGVVAVDSGPLHLARSLDIPSLGILSGGDYRRWFPPRGKADLIVPRGLWDRFPTTAEMGRAFRSWSRHLPLPTG